MNPCPPKDRLARFLEGILSESEQGNVATHLETCHSCRRVIEQELMPFSEVERWRRWYQECARGAESFLDSVWLHSLAWAFSGGEGGRKSSSEQPPVFPGYRILDLLGQGGMGTVYRAVQLSLNRVVALKVLRAGAHASPGEKDRLLAEATTLARLRHPHIVQVYEAGEYGGHVFLALEYCPGGSLQRQLEGTPLPPREAAQLVRSLAEAVSTAHGSGVIHRDLKTSNILLQGKLEVPKESPAATGLPSRIVDYEPKVSDFGLAKRLDEDGQTASGTALGTPSYMAPEQARGEWRQVGPPTDVYGLGAILYELLTGRPPFRAPSTFDTLHQVVHEEPVRPGQFTARIPRDLETICLKSLQKKIAKRYGSAGELAEDLGRFLEGKPVRARPVGYGERAWGWCRRNPVVAGLMTAVALSLIGGTGTALYYAGEARAKAGEAEEKARSEKAAREKADAESYFLSIFSADTEWRDTNLPQAQRLLDRCPEDQRRWEWYYLRRLCNSHLLHSGTHRGEARSVAASLDGQFFASTGQDGTVRLWESATNRLRWSREGHSGGCNRVAFCPIGKRLASAGVGRQVKVWCVETGQLLHTLSGHDDSIQCIAFNPNGDRLASGGYDKTVILWDLRSGGKRKELKGYSDIVSALAFSPDGRSIAAAVGLTIRVRKADSGEEVCTFTGHKHRPSCLVFSADSRELYSATTISDERYNTQRSEILAWDVASGDKGRLVGDQPQTIDCLALSPDGRLLAATGERTVRLWDIASGRLSRTVRGHSAFWSVAFVNQNRVVTGEQDGSVRLWDVTTDQRARSVFHPAFARSVAFSPDGECVASAHGDGVLRVCSSDSGKERLRITAHQALLHAVAYSPDGKRLASTGRDPLVKVWDADTGEECLVLRGHQDFVFGVAFSPDGKRLATASRDGTIKLWEAESGQCLLTLTGHESHVYCVAFSPDGRWLASGGAHGTAILWDLESGQVLRSWDGHQQEVPGVAFSPDGRFLATTETGPGAVVRVWNIRTGAMETVCKGHKKKISGVTFCPDGRRLASTSDDGTVLLWEAGSGRLVLTLPDHVGATTCVTFSRDGRRMATAGWDGNVKVWDAGVAMKAVALPVE